MNRTFIRILTVFRSTIELQRLNTCLEYKNKIGRKGIEPSTAIHY